MPMLCAFRQSFVWPLRHTDASDGLTAQTASGLQRLSPPDSS